MNALRKIAIGLTAVAGIGSCGSDGPRNPIGSDPSISLTKQRITKVRAPTYTAAAPGVQDRIFVLEQEGRIFSAPLEGRDNPREFLDVRALVGSPGERPILEGESGALSVAFAPDYEETGLFYLTYSTLGGDIQLDEYRRTDDPLRADRGSRRPLLTVPHGPGKNHFGGQLAFGPDHLLYMSTGDGGFPVDSTDETADRDRHRIARNAADLDSLLGKILRLDPEPSGGRPYSAPADNPFAGGEGRPEIFAYGLRNPWRFSFSAEEEIQIADVGEVVWEEINWVPIERASGGNFGWPAFEGNTRWDKGTPAEGRIPPAYVFNHGGGAEGGACAVIGGHVVEDPGLPALEGRYVFGDYCTGTVGTIGRPDPEAEAPVEAIDHKLIVPALSSFGRGPNSEVIATSLGGDVFRVVAAENPAGP